jgi:hypothetical protein
MTVREFVQLGGYEADASFATRLGLRCAKIYQAIYNKPPTKKRRGEAWRNKVCVFPCGVIEQAYRQLTEEGAQTTPQQTSRRAARDNAAESAHREPLSNLTTVVAATASPRARGCRGC